MRFCANRFRRRGLTVASETVAPFSSCQDQGLLLSLLINLQVDDGVRKKETREEPPTGAPNLASRHPKLMAFSWSIMALSNLNRFYSLHPLDRARVSRSWNELGRATSHRITPKNKSLDWAAYVPLHADLPSQNRSTSLPVDGRQRAALQRVLLPHDPRGAQHRPNLVTNTGTETHAHRLASCLKDSAPDAMMRRPTDKEQNPVELCCLADKQREVTNCSATHVRSRNVPVWGHGNERGRNSKRKPARGHWPILESRGVGGR